MSKVPVAEISEKLPRSLGLWSIWMLVVNGIIGAGIFGLPSGAALYAGEYSIYVYLICAMLMLPVILSFAELTSYFRGTGGPIKYCTEAFGSFVGFQAGWLFYIARMVSFSANSVLLVDSIGYFFPAIGSGIYRIIALLIICGGLALINVLGAVSSIRSLAIFTIVKLAVLILLVLAGLYILGDGILPKFEAPTPSFSNFGTATLLLIYAFVGFESAVVPAGEAKNPTRDMPRALILGMLVVSVIYILIQMVSLASVPGLADSSTPLLDTANALAGRVGAVILMAGVVASVGGNLVGAMFSTPRVTYALAIDKSLPGWFSFVHPRFLTPSNSIIFFGIFAFLLAAFGSFIWLAAATVLSRLFMYILSCAAIPKLRPRLAATSGFILPGKYIIPILGILSCVWLMFQVSWDNILATFIFISVGTGLYLVARKKS